MPAGRSRRCWAPGSNAVVLRRECMSVGLARRIRVLVLLARWPEVDLAKPGWRRRTRIHECRWIGSGSGGCILSGVDLWAGRIKVSEESGTDPRWTERYAVEQDPIHGASLGFSATLYSDVGGFHNLRCGEDRDLHGRAVARGFRIRYDPAAAVTTSARRTGRAPAGFAGVLRAMDEMPLDATVWSPAAAARGQSLGPRLPAGLSSDLDRSNLPGVRDPTAFRSA